MRRTIFVVCALIFAIVGIQTAKAGGLGKFVTALIARGAVSAGIRSAGSYAHTIKTYPPDTLTVDQLVTCLKKASGLDQESDRLEAERPTLVSLASEVNRLGDEIDQRRVYVNHYSQIDVDRFNHDVDHFNSLAADTKNRQLTFNSGVTSHNIKVEAFNAECAKRYYADDMEAARKLAGI